MKFSGIAAVLCCFVFCLQAQNRDVIDSLEKKLTVPVQDTEKITTLQDLCREHRYNNLPKALKYGYQALALSKKINNKEKIVSSFLVIGKAYTFQGKDEPALELYKEFLKYGTESRDKQILAEANKRIGGTYYRKCNYPAALEYYIKSLKLNEEAGDKKAIAYSYTDIGNIYYYQEKFDVTLQYYLRALKIQEETGDNPGISDSYYNISWVYSNLMKYSTALDYALKSLRMALDFCDKSDVANIYNLIGGLYQYLNNYKLAKEYQFKSLKIKEELHDSAGIAVNFNNIANIYNHTGDLDEAIRFYNKSFDIIRNTSKRKEGYKHVYQGLSEVYAKKGNYKKAFENFMLYTEIRDTLLSQENTRQIAQMQSLYETEKKDRAIELLNKDKVIQSAELKRQKLATYSVIAGFVVVAFLSFFIYRSLREKKKANAALSTAYREIEEKNKDITDSINYARRIQQAMLPSLDGISRALPDSFVLYRPKDVVSGDFYAFARREEKILLAAVDCTGHGVPGAFMSMIGNDLLNQIIIERNITTPALVLNHLHEGVRSALKQDSEQAETRDGMDVALVSLESAEGRTTLHYAGANRPLWIFRNSGEAVTEVKPDKYPIGGMQSEEKRIFSHHTFHLAKGETFYLFTDGFADQFGGEQGKKFMSKNLRDILLGIQHKSMQEQLSFLEHTFDSWKGKHQQVDDVLMIGVRV